MAGKQKSQEPCKKEACDIQSCLTKNNFNPQRCLKVIEMLQACCENCSYNSTHCASLSELLKTRKKSK
ncbi:cx9C motif-containing protein 4, mitochondrial [Dendrobium catenatum]|uniref:cx9C motif-containing protein 4, mitochondrial n=1 Tax=Dendrobium catenatum TaxID=906689 RepID=UPI0009F219B4|nr:cx9C motif-containing protein 4, mitochondrial [Dendrobium catenatum]